MGRFVDAIWMAPHTAAKLLSLSGEARQIRMANNREAWRLTKAFGTRLRACRIAAGFETADLFADTLGIEGPRYRRYERGESLPPIDLLKQLCTVLNTTSDFLLFGAPTRN